MDGVLFAKSFCLKFFQTVSTALELRRPVYRNVASRVIDYEQVQLSRDVTSKTNEEGDVRCTYLYVKCIPLLTMMTQGINLV